MSDKTAKLDVIAMEQTFAAGVRAHLTKKAVTIQKQTVKAEAIARQVDAHIALIKASELARTRWLQAVATERTAGSGVKQLMRSVQAYALATFGEDSSEYSDFGFAPRKKRAQTPASKVLQGERLRATRAARHTLGKKQRLAVKGTVPPAVASEVSGASPAAAVTTATATVPAVLAAPQVAPAAATAPIVVVVPPSPSAAPVPAAPSGTSNGVANSTPYSNGANGYATGFAKPA